MRLKLPLFQTSLSQREQESCCLLMTSTRILSAVVLQIKRLRLENENSAPSFMGRAIHSCFIILCYYHIVSLNSPYDIYEAKCDVSLPLDIALTSSYRQAKFRYLAENATIEPDHHLRPKV